MTVRQLRPMPAGRNGDVARFADFGKAAIGEAEPRSELDDGFRPDEGVEGFAGEDLFVHEEGCYNLPSMKLTRGLLIRSPHIDRILAGTKTWELRGSATKVRGRIGLIKSKSGTVVGSCEVCDVVGPLSLAELRKNARKAGFAPSQITEPFYPRTYAWVLHKAKRFRAPVPYRHPSGAVIWVDLIKAIKRRK